MQGVRVRVSDLPPALETTVVYCPTFGLLREEKDFADVTLVTEDNQEVEAYKVILAALSPYF